MSVLEAAIGWLAPSQCISCEAEGNVLCKSCSTSGIVPFGERCWQCAKLSPRSRTCESCRRQSSPSFVWVTTVYEGSARRLVSSYKFDHQRAAAGSLARLMAQTLLKPDQERDIRALDYLLVPVPTATSRIRQRGFDQTRLLARQIARKTGFSTSGVLGRLGQISQVGAPRPLRLAQPVGKYFVRKPKAVKGRSILLIDDVLTTGATLREVTKMLRAAGAKRVDALVFAKRL